MYNNSQSILSAMRPKQTQKFTEFEVYTKEGNRRVMAHYIMPSIFADLAHLILPSQSIAVPRIAEKDSIEEAYHQKVVNCWFRLVSLTCLTSLIPSSSPLLQLRLVRQSEDNLPELFTITDHSQVSKLLDLLQQVREYIYKNNDKKAAKGLLNTVIKEVGLEEVLESINIAWTATPLFYFTPSVAIEWLQKYFQTKHFFFPSEKAQFQLEEQQEMDCFSQNQLQPLKRILQLRHLLATYLRKAIVLRCDTSQIPSELAKLKKIREYGYQHSSCSRTALDGLFQTSLLEVMYQGVPNNIKVLHRLEEQYFVHLEEEAKRLIDQLDVPVQKKPSKRAKRNMKKAEVTKLKKEQQQLSSIKVSVLPVNPEEEQAKEVIVDKNAYKIRKHQETNLTTESIVEDPKQQIQTEKMFIDYFVPPTHHRRQGSNETTNESESVSSKEEERNYENRTNNNWKGRNNKRKYEEKTVHPIEFIDFEFQAQKAATNIMEQLLQTKLAKINTENKQMLQLKTNAYNKLLSYFGVRLPYFSVNIFGSLASGVSLPCSDIDLLLTPQVTLYIDQYFLNDLAEELSTFGWVTSCDAILTAKIPVIKLIIDPFVCEDNPQSQFKYYSHEQQLNAPFLIKFDITLNTSGQNNTGLISTTYMQNIFNFRPKLTEAMLVIKHLLQNAKLNEGYRGGISSYNIFLMLICFTQHSHFNLEAPLSQLLYKFFTFYGKEFDYQSSVLRYECGQSCVLSCEEYSLLPNAEVLGNSGGIKVIDPINGKLVRASFSRFEEVLDLFRRLADAFKGVREEARLAVQPLMGKPNKRSGEIAAVAHARTQTSKNTAALAALLLIQ